MTLVDFVQARIQDEIASGDKQRSTKAKRLAAVIVAHRTEITVELEDKMLLYAATWSDHPDYNEDWQP